MTDDTKRDRPYPRPVGGNADPAKPAQDPFHNIILFPPRPKNEDKGPPPPSAA